MNDEELTNDLADEITALMPADMRDGFGSLGQVMGCWYCYHSVGTLIGWESVLRYIDQAGVDTSAIRQKIADHQAACAIGAGV